MSGIRDDLREEARELNQMVSQYDDQTLNGVITTAYEDGDMEAAEPVLKSAYELYTKISDLGQRSITVAENEIEDPMSDEEFPVVWDTFSEFHRDFEHALMRYVGITEEVDDGQYETIENFLEDYESGFPEWIKREDFEASEFVD